MLNYKWDNKEIIKRYLNSLGKVIKTKDENVKDDLLIDLDNLKDMILFSILELPDVSLGNIRVKKYLDLDRDFLTFETTSFQRKTIESHIPRIIDSKIKLTNLTFSYDPKNIIDETLDFLSKTNPELYKFLQSTIENKQLLIKNNLQQNSYAGTTYALTDCSFLEILLNSNHNPCLTLNHELVHGYVNKITKRRFEKPYKYILYREVGSLLTELYANDYLYTNKLISYEEFVTNFNDFFVVNSYNDIELIDVLFTLATNSEMKNNYFNVKKFVDSKAIENPNYDIRVKELTEYPLKHYLIYLYSSMIAMSLYYNFRDDSKNGLNAAIDIMENVTPENEETLFKKYELNPEKSLEDYTKENNAMILKKNS